MISLRTCLGWLGCGCLSAWAVHSPVAIPINEVESAVPPYTLPDTLTLQNGRRVTTAAQWPRATGMSWA